MLNRDRLQFLDEQELAEVARIVESLAREHVVRRGVSIGVDTLKLCELAADDPELSNKLRRAYLGAILRFARRRDP